MEGILLETMYDLPGLESVEQVVIGPEVVEGKAKPLFIHGERADQIGKRQCLNAAFGASNQRRLASQFLKRCCRLASYLLACRRCPLIDRGTASRTECSEQ